MGCRVSGAALAAPLLNRDVSMFLSLREQRGFSLTELMLVVGIAGTLMAMAVPVMTDITGTIKLNEAVRAVERELQDARLKAVSANRPLRVRTNCPAAGFIRTVEVLGTVVDAAANRCQQAAYPFPADDNLMTRPNYDGPVRVIPNGATVPTVTYQFQPDGTVLLVVSNVASMMASEQTVTVTRKNNSRSVRVNGAGKIQLQ
jgi:prepilin-type N-terminal cleavage/methylation domain-containing protein